LRAGRLPVGVYHAWRDIVHSLHCFGLQLYDEMQEHGIKPNQSIFTVMATVFAKCGNLDRGIKAWLWLGALMKLLPCMMKSEKKVSFLVHMLLALLWWVLSSVLINTLPNSPRILLCNFLCAT
jgi:hypothetical protein